MEELRQPRCATPLMLLASGMTVGAFDARASAHSEIILNLSSLAPATNLYRRLHCLRLVRLVRVSTSEVLPMSHSCNGLVEMSCRLLQSRDPLGPGVCERSDLSVQALDDSSEVERPLFAWRVLGPRHCTAAGG